MHKKLIQEIWEYFKDNYRYEINSPTDFFEKQRDLLEFVMCLGRDLEQSLIDNIGTGYKGIIIRNNGKDFKFKGNRKQGIHGLFGIIDYKRAYYVCTKKGGGSYIPLDEKLGIEKRHTPGCNYFMTFFTCQGVYQKSINQFHEIFRPDGKDFISMRKVLDMDYELGKRLENIQQNEIEQLFERGEEIKKDNMVAGIMAVSIDATKVREKLREEIISDNIKRYEIGFKDAKIAAISNVIWEKKKKEAKCKNNTYVSAVEHADDFFKRIWLEMNKRSENIENQVTVFIGDGAPWIWNRVIDLANEKSILILDFYHACEHLVKICKDLYGEETEDFWDNYKNWKELLYMGKVNKVIEQLRQIMKTVRKQSILESLLGEIKYFEDNKGRMK